MFFSLFLRQWLFLMTQTNSSVEEVILCKFVRNYFHNLSVQKTVTFLIKSHGSRQIRRWRRRRDHQSWCSAVMYKNGYKIWTTGITKKGFGTKMTGKKFLIILIVMYEAVKPTQTAKNSPKVGTGLGTGFSF